MLKSITLQNFKSFGEEQTVPLEPITVLVGPNNSGKSNFMSVGRFVNNGATRRHGGDYSADIAEAIEIEGGTKALRYRPQSGDGAIEIKWATEDSNGKVTLPADLFNAAGALYRVPERFVLDSFPPTTRVDLRVDAMRQEALLGPRPSIASDGSGIAAVLADWRNSLSPQAVLLDQIISKALPEIEHVLGRFSETPGHARLYIQQRDGEQFDATRLSDGLLFFLGLVVHALSAPADAVIFIEEPETGIHPRRLGEVVDVLRTVVNARRQIIISTHSPTLLNEFRHEPESIVLFRRGPNGTQVRRLTEAPYVREALEQYDARPGDLLANGAFNDPF